MVSLHGLSFLRFPLSYRLHKAAVFDSPEVASLKFTPMLLFILSVSKATISPLNKQNIEISGPFFQGWLVRIIDHREDLSLICIVGSFSAHKEAKYSQHYVFSAVNGQDMKEHAELFVDPENVLICGGENKLQELDITWNSSSVGGFKFNDVTCTGNFTFPNRFSVQFQTAGRMKWAKSRMSFSGPEGWLGLTSALLPCHYSVHSTGSNCTYRIQRFDTSMVRPSSVRKAGLLNRMLNWRRSDASFAASTSKEIEGEGFAHIEGNHGSSFPEGWIWSQGIALNNSASYSLVLGKFGIAGLTPTTCILYLRRRGGGTVVVRTTDFDRVTFTTNASDGSVSLNATSLLKQCRLEMSIETAGDAEKAFGVTVQIPTAKGFSQYPGCKETYTAQTRIKYTDLSSRRSSATEEYLFPLSALEYGGNFVEKLSK